MEFCACQKQIELELLVGLCKIRKELQQKAAHLGFCLHTWLNEADNTIRRECVIQSFFLCFVRV